MYLNFDSVFCFVWFCLLPRLLKKENNPSALWAEYWMPFFLEVLRNAPKILNFISLFGNLIQHVDFPWLEYRSKFVFVSTEAPTVLCTFEEYICSHQDQNCS